MRRILPGLMFGPPFFGSPGTARPLRPTEGRGPSPIRSSASNTFPKGRLVYRSSRLSAFTGLPWQRNTAAISPLACLADEVARRLSQLVVAQRTKVGVVLPHPVRQLDPAVRDLEIRVVALGRGVVPLSLAGDQQTSSPRPRRRSPPAGATTSRWPRRSPATVSTRRKRPICAGPDTPNCRRCPVEQPTSRSWGCFCRRNTSAISRDATSARPNPQFSARSMSSRWNGVAYS